ncbi:hypothetical protein LBMAG13_19040 [Actinomycetes bacterium]|nr:hypothetical protein LBMAG13_19040 [Actinomycetes bacterium]
MNRSKKGRVLKRFGIAIAITLGASVISVGTGHAASTPAPTRGGTLSIGITDYMVGFCPNDTNSNSALMPVKQIGETLFEQRADGVVVPFLASSASANADFTSWRITTRTGVTFSNGEKWNADALIINMKANRGVLSGGGSATADSTRVNPAASLFHGAKYGGLAPVAWANTKAVTKIDDVTVQFDLKRPNAGFKELLYGSGRSFMRAPAMFTPENNPGTKLTDIDYLCSKQMIGTGPFKMNVGDLSADKGTITLTKNETYWRKDAKGAKLPYLDKLVFTTTKDAATRVNGLKAGTTDMAWFTGNSESNAIIRAQKIKSIKTNLSNADFYPQLWFVENKAPFNKLSCRQAVSAAIDRNTYATKRSSGLMKPMTSIFGSTNAAYTTKNFITYDVTKAKAYLATCLTDLGATELAFGVPYDTAPEAQKNGAELKTQLAAVGIKMTVLPVETSSIITNTFASTATTGYQAIWFSVLEGPGNQFNSLFMASTSNGFYDMAADLYGSLSTLNVSRHTDKDFDTLWFGARALKAGAAQDAKYQEAIARWQEQAHSTSIIGVQFAVSTTDKIMGVCELKLISGGTARCVSNGGTSLAGVSKNK